VERAERVVKGVWDKCGGSGSIRRISGKAYRVVEGQHVISTRKLVDSVEEQAVLESLIEKSKPSLPEAPEFRRLHYLLATPFRYPPLRHGSRFSTRNEPAIWYGSTRIRTALAETAYYRLLFLEGTDAEIGPLVVEMTAFRTQYRTSRGVDMCRGEYERYRSTIAASESYTETQQLGASMRGAGVEAFRYPSARNPGGANIGLFTPRAFRSHLPESPESYSAVMEKQAVEFIRRDFLRRSILRFPREVFEVNGKLPLPAA
jgi:hypothetical protein